MNNQCLEIIVLRNALAALFETTQRLNLVCTATEFPLHELDFGKSYCTVLNVAEPAEALTALLRDLEQQQIEYSAKLSQSAAPAFQALHYRLHYKRNGEYCYPHQEGAELVPELETFPVNEQYSLLEGNRDYDWHAHPIPATVSNLPAVYKMMVKIDGLDYALSTLGYFCQGYELNTGILGPEEGMAVISLCNMLKHEKDSLFQALWDEHVEFSCFEVNTAQTGEAMHLRIWRDEDDQLNAYLSGSFSIPPGIDGVPKWNTSILKGDLA